MSVAERHDADMEQRHLAKNPIQRIIPKIIIIDGLFVLPGIACIMLLPEIGMPLGIALIVMGGMCTGMALPSAIRRTPCQECGRACRLELPTQKRFCDTCEIEWLLPVVGTNTQSHDL